GGVQMKKTIYAAVFLLVLGMVLVGCSRGGDSGGSSGDDDSTSNNSNDGGPIDVQIGSGTQTGNYYPLGAALAKVWNDEVDGVNASSQATDASVENLQ